MNKGLMIVKDHWKQMVQQRQGRYGNNKAYAVSDSFSLAAAGSSGTMIRMATSSTADNHVWEIDQIIISCQKTSSSLSTQDGGFRVVVYQTASMTDSGASLNVVAVNRLGTPTAARFTTAHDSTGNYATLTATTLLNLMSNADQGPYVIDDGWVIGSNILAIENMYIEITNLYPVAVEFTIKIRLIEKYLAEFDNDIIVT